MFPGYLIFATIYLLNPSLSSGTISPDSQLKLDFSYINFSNIDLSYSSIGAENITLSNSTDFSLQLVSNSQGFFNYSNTTISPNIAGDYVLSLNDTDTQSVDYTSIYLINKSLTESITYSFDTLYLLVPSNGGSSNVGGDIVSGITSGLELMKPIASEFLDGFGALFWNTTASELTMFGQFSLIFLGVSITFAVVKLALNLIRGKTGA